MRKGVGSFEIKEKGQEKQVCESDRIKTKHIKGRRGGVVKQAHNDGNSVKRMGGGCIN